MGRRGWDTASLDAAFAEPPGGKERRRLVGDLLAGPFHRYARAVRADRSRTSRWTRACRSSASTPRNVLGYDAVVLLLDELVLWLAGVHRRPDKVREEAQKVSKLVESRRARAARADHQLRAPPAGPARPGRQGRRGREVTSLFDMLKYWDGRFDRIPLDDSNLPAIVHERLLKPKDADARPRARRRLRAGRQRPRRRSGRSCSTRTASEGDRDAFRLTYPFSPAFLHAMVDISGALQRERTALKLMQQLLVDYRDTLPVGQLMPLGAIFDVLAAGADRPFTDKLRDEFEQAKRFYTIRVRPVPAEQARPHRGAGQRSSAQHPFRADDLVVKTLLLAALVPNVPALSGLTATRLAALNHGSIVTMLPNQERASVARTLKDLGAQFGEIRLSGSEDDPRVDLALIGVDTEGIIRDSRHADDDAARRRLIRDLLWEELDLKDEGTFDHRDHGDLARHRAAAVEVLMDNVRDEERMPPGGVSRPTRARSG